MVIRRKDDQALEPSIVTDGDRVRPALRRPREHDHAVADREDRSPVGVVELDALMLLEIAAHRRAVAVRLVDVRLVGEGDRPSEPRMARAAGVRVGPLLVRDAHERQSLIDAADPEAGGSPGGVHPRREQQQRADAPRHVADVERVAVLRVHALARTGERAPRRRAHERLHRRQVYPAAFHDRSDRAGRSSPLIEPCAVCRIEPVEAALRAHPDEAPGIRRERPHPVDALGVGGGTPRRRRVFRPGAAAVRRAGEAAQMAGPQTAVGAAGQRQHVLAAQPAPGVGCRDRAGRVGDLRPGRAAIPRQLDAVGGAHIHGVAPRDDAVGRDVLPLGAELLELPVGPCLAAVGRQAPPVPHRAVPDFPVGTESEGMDEIEGNRPRGRVIRVLELFPAPGPSAQHEDALPIGPDPDGVVGRASQREHVHAEARGVGERGEGLGAGTCRQGDEQQSRQQRGTRNAERGAEMRDSGTRRSP